MKMSAWLAILLVLTVASPAAPQTASLVRDLNTTGNVGGSLPVQITAVQNKVFFLAPSYNSGKELWVSDGTAAGTRLLLDDCPGVCDGDYYFAGVLHDLLFFLAPVGSSYRLWRSDGTPEGTFPIGPELELSLRAFWNGALYFTKCSLQGGSCSLWRTDGTADGTEQILALQSELLTFLTTDGHRLFFGSGVADATELWTSDGTAAGTSLIATLDSIAAVPFTVPGEPLFLVTPELSPAKLWASDGTPAGTLSLGQFHFIDFAGERIRATGGRIYFVADETFSSRDVWTSDGTPAGTLRVTDFAPANIPIGRVRRAGERAVFIAPDGIHGDRLWSSQGTPATTAPLPSPCTGCSFVNRSEWLQEAGSRVLFFGSDPAHGAELWTTDGTAAGTRLVADLCPGSCSSVDPLHPVLSSIPSGILFEATDRHGLELWRSDGTRAGTVRVTNLGSATQIGTRQLDAPAPDPLQPEAALAGGTVYFAATEAAGPALWAAERPSTTRQVARIAPEGPSSQPRNLTPFQNRLLFLAFDGSSTRLWSSDGTSAGTFTPGIQAPYQYISWEPTPAAGALFLRQSGSDPFGSTDGSLWRTDGTTAGTFRLKEGGVNIGLTAYQDRLYFASGSADHPEIWRSDGTPAGTVKAFDAPPGNGIASHLQGVGNDLYFVEELGFPGWQLLKSDGTAAGTRTLATLGHFSSFYDLQFRPLSGRLLFRAETVWTTDGTPEGTVRLQDGPGATGIRASDLTVFQGSLYFFAATETARGLWRTDGTPSGTVLVKEFSGFSFAQPRTAWMTSGGGRLWFAAADDDHGFELWQSDGTAAGTVMVRDIAPGPDDSLPFGLAYASGRLYFGATDGRHGVEPWQSDGTAAGTRMIQDIAPLGMSSLPASFTAIGDRLFFSADDGPSGFELWTLPLTGAAGCQPSDSSLCLLGGRYRVEARWRDFQGHAGTAHAAPLTADTGTFWFFDPANVEVLLKVLDGGGVNGHVWVFYGALSNVEYTLTVTDTQTGLARQYFNPSGQLASVGDIHAFGPLGAQSVTPRPTIAAPSPPPIVSESLERKTASPCQPTAQRLCLNSGRFAVDVSWRDFQGHTGQGMAVPYSGDTGTFWFFAAANIELAVKVLDGRPVNGHFWLFYGALSNVEYTVTVTDTQTGAIRTYRNPSGRFASVADVQAF